MDSIQKELVARLSLLQVLTIRYVERNTNLRCVTHRDMQNVIQNGVLCVSYMKAVENLKNNIQEYCYKSDYLMLEVTKLEADIKNSSIATLRFGVGKLTELENELDKEKTIQFFYNLTSMVSSKDASIYTGINQETIKQACMQERLLNTQKVGKSWVVHIPEVEKYWGIELKATDTGFNKMSEEI